MTWSLEIHHIGLPQEGDATLLIAKDTPAPTATVPVPAPTTVRSMLVDGGLMAHAFLVHQQLTNAGVHSLDVMVATHYDKDHYFGLRGLLAGGHFDPNYNNVLIFDQGEQGNIPANSQGPYDNHINRVPTGRDTPYIQYLSDIHRNGTKPGRHRITAVVSSDGTGFLNVGWRPPYWLIGKEILWSAATRFNSNGNYDPDGNFDNTGQFINNNFSSWDANGNPLDINGNSLIPNGAPTVYCLAANQYVYDVTGQINQVVSGQTVDPRNEKSLIFLVTFGNFKYYVGGDAELAQEDALIGVLNPTSNDAGRVHAMKLSHHGAATATSLNFVDDLRPKAAFISNGPNNRFGHPHQAPINHLEGRSVLALNNAMPPAAAFPHGLQNYYMTGTSTLGATNNRPAPATLNPNLVIVPTYPQAQTSGERHLVIKVSDTQSTHAADGHNIDNFTVHWWNWTSLQLGILRLIAPMAQQVNH